MNAEIFLKEKQDWDKDSKGMFDFNGLENLLNDYKKEFEAKHRQNIKMQVHGEELNEKKFEELARPMIKYLCENYHPHVTVIITPTNAELLQGLKSTGDITDYIRD